MKQLIAIPVLLASMSAAAQPYISLGYGVNSISHDQSVAFSDGARLTPDNSESMFSGSAGYRFDNNFGIEVSYGQFDQDASRSQFQGFNSDNTMTIDRKWEADMKARQFAVKPAYFFDVNDKLTVKGTAGITYTQYEISGHHFDEYESIIDDGPEYDQTVETVATVKDNAVGMIAGIAADYQLYQGLHVGAEANYHSDSLASSLQLLGTVSYQF